MSDLLKSSRIKELAREKSVRGFFVTLVMEEAEQVETEERLFLEEALQDLLERFQAVEGENV